jgi:hypothetical protein
MILITYIEFTNGGTSSAKPTSAALDYCEWLRDGRVEYSHATVEGLGLIDTDHGEVDGIPLDVRQAIAKIVLEDGA